MNELYIEKFKNYYCDIFNLINKEKLSNILVESDPDTISVASKVFLYLYDKKATTTSSDVLYIKDNPITIETARYVKTFTSFKPDNLKYRIVILMGLENLTQEAGNALLKALEESKEYVVFLNFTSNSHKILKTILSRSIIFKLNPIRIKDENIPPKILKYINGSLGRYIAYLQNFKSEPKIRNLSEAVEEYLQSFNDTPTYFINRNIAFEYLRRFDSLKVFTLINESLGKKFNKSSKLQIISDLSERMVELNYKNLSFAIKIKQNLELNIDFQTALLTILNRICNGEKLYA